jgi:hypothetical protein
MMESVADGTGRTGGMAAGPVPIECDCGAKLKVPAQAIGRLVKCPKCDGVLRVAQPDTLGIAPLEVGGGSDPGALVNELAAQPRSAPAKGSAAGGAPSECPSCGAPLPAAAKLCVQCGFQVDTGRKLTAAEVGKGKVAGAAGKAAGAAGRTGLGIALCVVGAMLGAAVWYAVATLTGYEIGWIAWGIGILAGAGMLLGTGGPSSGGAVVAAGAAALGIVAGKLLVFYLVAVPQAEDAYNDSEIKRAAVAEELATEHMELEGVLPSEWDRIREGVLPEAQKIVSGMSDERVNELWDDKYGDTVLGSLSSSSAFFKAMFGWLDILFILLALGSAAKLAGSGITKGGD